MDRMETIEETRAEDWAEADEKTEKLNAFLTMKVFPKFEYWFRHGKIEGGPAQKEEWEELRREFILMRDRFENEMHMRIMDRQPIIDEELKELEEKVESAEAVNRGCDRTMESFCGALDDLRRKPKVAAYGEVAGAMAKLREEWERRRYSF